MRSKPSPARAALHATASRTKTPMKAARMAGCPVAGAGVGATYLLPLGEDRGQLAVAVAVEIVGAGVDA